MRVPYARIISLNDNECDIVALVDSGSSISLNHESVYREFRGNDNLREVGAQQLYQSMNNSNIEISGKLAMS